MMLLRLIVAGALMVAMATPVMADSMGGPGDDVIYGTRSDDILTGGGGDDTIYSRRGSDVVIGGPGRDVCFVSSRDVARGCEVTFPGIPAKLRVFDTVLIGGSIDSG